MLNVVILNGGRGAGKLIPALLQQEDLQITSIVNAYDDGKSTGEVRRFFEMLGPSDIRKVQQLMLSSKDPCFENYLKLFQHRFSVNTKREEAFAEITDFIEGKRKNLVGAEISSDHVRASLIKLLSDFKQLLLTIEKLKGEEFNFSDCSIMNCIYAGAFIHFKRNIEEATLYMDRLFRLKGTVMATSNENKHLVALRENGEVLYSEAQIVELRSNVRIERIYLLDHCLEEKDFEKLTLQEKRYYLETHNCYVRASPSVILAIQQADIIIYSAGTQHSSLYPSYITTGLAESIADNRNALKVFITNIGADYETPMYKASDYLYGAYKYLDLSDDRQYSLRDLFSVVLVNQSKIKADNTYVEYNSEGFENVNIPVIVDEYESHDSPGKHDGEKLVSQILKMHKKGVGL